MVASLVVRHAVQHGGAARVVAMVSAEMLRCAQDNSSILSTNLSTNSSKLPRVRDMFALRNLVDATTSTARNLANESTDCHAPWAEYENRRGPGCKG